MNKKFKDTIYIIRKNFLECIRRAITSGLMYYMLGLVLLAVHGFVEDPALFFIVCAGVFAFAGFLNAHQMLMVSEMHYKMKLTGDIRRANAMETMHNLDVRSYKFQQEYRPWKGFVIGLSICLPGIIFTLCGAIPVSVVKNEATLQVNNVFQLILFITYTWQLVPVTFISQNVLATALAEDVLFYYSMLTYLIPILISGIFYLIGGAVAKKKAENGTLNTPTQGKKKGKR